MHSKLVLLTIVACVAGTYCPGKNPGNQQAQDSSLGNVVMEGTEHKGGCPGGTNIQWFPKTQFTVSAGASHSITIQVITCGNSYARTSAVWIDFNGNQKFETWEKVGEAKVDPVKDPVLVTMEFKSPSKTSSKVTDAKAMYLSPNNKPNSRMRVQVVENGFDPMDPCLQFPYGAVQDFPVISVSGGLDLGSILLIVAAVCTFVGFFAAMAVFFHFKKVPPMDFVKETFLPPVATFCGLVKAGALFTAHKCKSIKKGESADYNEL